MQGLRKYCPHTLNIIQKSILAKHREHTHTHTTDILVKFNIGVKQGFKKLVRFQTMYKIWASVYE